MQRTYFAPFAVKYLLSSRLRRAGSFVVDQDLTPIALDDFSNSF